MDKITIMSLNVRGLGNKTKRGEIFYQLRQSCAKIICLQETHSTDKTSKMWAAEWGGEAIFSHGTSNARGVAILVKRNSNVKIKNVIKDKVGRLLVVDLCIMEETVRLINIYAPNVDDPEYFVEVFKYASNDEIMYCMVNGDFNVVIDPQIDRTDGKAYNIKAADVIRDQLEDGKFHDVWRQMHLNVVKYSWHRSLPLYTGSRLDMALVNGAAAK